MNQSSVICSITSSAVVLLMRSIFLLLLGNVSANAHSGGHDPMQRAMDAEQKHRFELAEHHLREIIAADPRDAQAWLKLASLETVRGQLADARVACSQAARLSGALVALACRGRIALAGGESQRAALHALLQTLEHPSVRGRSDEVALWAWGVAAELAVATKAWSQADRLFARALTGQPAVHLEAAYLDHLIATRRSERVLAYVSPEDMELARRLRRLIAQVELGGCDALESGAEALHQQFLRWMRSGDYTHGREMAMFYLTVLPNEDLARQAATSNLLLQREKEDMALHALVMKPTALRTEGCTTSMATPS
ncbi:MAG: hypothetical protein AB8B57_14805 [Congregibacter sp.]